MSNGDEKSVNRVWQVFDGTPVAGKNIRLSADVGFLNIEENSKPWAGILFVLRAGTDDMAEILTPDPAPNWYVPAFASPPNSWSKIASTYKVPMDVDSLYLKIEIQNGAGQNVGVVDNVCFEVFP